MREVARVFQHGLAVVFGVGSVTLYHLGTGKAAEEVPVLAAENERAAVARAIALKVWEQQEVSSLGEGVPDSCVHEATQARSQPWKRNAQQPSWTRASTGRGRENHLRGKNHDLIGTKPLQNQLVPQVVDALVCEQHPKPAEDCWKLGQKLRTAPNNGSGRKKNS